MTDRTDDKNLINKSPVKILLAVLPVLITIRLLTAAQGVDYLRDVKPILAANCYACHGGKVQMSGLRLDTGAFVLKGSMTGPIVVPGKSAQSELIAVLAEREGKPRMPFRKPPLTPEQITVLKTWVDEGARAPEKESPDDGLNQSKHWSFIPPSHPAVPTGKNQAWVRNDIDRFVLAGLEKEGLAPSPEADRVTLIRRLSLDLVGLPPSLKDIDIFVADSRPDAYERLVDRLLESPHYGERWGRHWLDLARYADSNGYSIDSPREVWKYRDWVIAAFNRDLGFDQFVIEQIAGDMLPSATVDQKIASGFHRNTSFNQEGGIDKEQFRVDAVADRVSTTGTVFLGLTIGCARCHNHKYDPITQREYYQLFAFLNNADEPILDLAPAEQVAKRDAIRPQLQLLEKELQEYQAQWLSRLPETERQAIPRDITTILSLLPDQRDDKQSQKLADFLGDRDIGLRERFATVSALKAREPKFPTTLVMEERAKPRESYIHIGGDFTRKGETVSPGVLRVLHPLPSVEKPNRLDLARWLADPKNPLIARVTVNRIWQQYFGRGLVDTENDFGTQGSKPTHPELLDWLATEFMSRGWSQKTMHRMIVVSATYRQSSRQQQELQERDPYNRLLARQSRLRLDAEIIRDSALLSSGLLDSRVGGPSVYPPQPDGVFRFTQIPRVWSTSSGTDRYRRGLYTYFFRSAPHPALTVFDAPDGVATCTRRIRSNTPLQALTLLNDQAFVELAQGLANRILRESRATDDERLRYGFRLCLARDPGPAEKERLNRFLHQQLEEFRAAPKESQSMVSGKPSAKSDVPTMAAWTAVARVLLNLDEFITRE